MKRYFAFFFIISSLLTACGAPTPQPTPQLINVYVSSAAYPWINGFYNCSSTSAVINLSDPGSADITLRLGEPDHLTTPAYQISVEDILVIAHPQSGVGSLTLDQVRSIFLGQTANWKEVGGNDLPVQVWTFSPDEDVQGIFSKTVMNGEPVTSLARLATSALNMLKDVGTTPGSIGLLPRHLMAGEVKDVYTAGTAPVLAITKSEPQGVVQELIRCLQENH
jgi:hypothetical protein